MTESEGPLLVDTGSGLNIRYHGRNLYSPASPILAAEKRADAYTILPDTLLFVPSPLLFYGIDHLLASIPDRVHLLCVEVDQALMRLTLDNAPGEVISNPLIHLVRTDSPDELLKQLHQIGVGRFRRCVEIAVNGGRSVHRELYTRLFRALEYEVQSHWRNRVTLMHMAHLWIKNFFVNLPEISLGGDLSRKKIDLPVVVAGAGESLEGAMPMLNHVRDQYYLLAVDTAVRSLVGNGLVPDAVVVLDAQAANLNDLIGFEAADTELFADITAYPECIRRFAGKRWFYFSQFAEIGLFSRARAAGLLPASVPPLGSVGIAAVYLAHALSRHAVVFAGLDFSYRAGKPHARGAPSHVASELRSGRLSPADSFAEAARRPHHAVQNKNGETVWSDNALSGYSSALQFYLADRERILDLGPEGLMTPAERIRDEASLARVLSRRDWPEERTSFQREGGRALPAEKGRSGERLRMVREFVETELELLKSSVRLVMDVLDGGNEGREGEVLSVLEEEDYVHLHFPDSGERDRRLSESFMKRFVEAAETSEQLIERTLTRLRTHTG